MSLAGLLLVTALSVLPSSANAQGAPGLSPAQAHDLIERYLADRAFRVTQAGAARTGTSLTAIPTTEALQHRLAAEALKLDEVRAMTLPTPSRGYIKAEVAVAVDHVSFSGPAEVTVAATERTKLYFGHGDPNAPQFEAYRLQHEFTFVGQTGVWTLSETTPKLEGGPPMPTQFGTTAATRVSADDDTAPQLPGTLPRTEVTTINQAGATAPRGVADKPRQGPSDIVPAYDYGAMYDFALRYWDNYNPTYRAYSNDCTNFISQIMEAGGWQYVGGSSPLETDDPDKWFYSNIEWEIPTSWTWAGAHNWGVFAQVYSQRTAWVPYVYQMLYTDVLQVNWDHPDEVPGEPEGNIDHTMIVTGILGNPGAAEEIYLTYHSNDRLHVPFWGGLLQDPDIEPRDVWYGHRT